MRKICLVTTNRSDFSRIESVARAIRAREDLELSLLVGGAHLLPDAGETIQHIVAGGLPITAQAYTIVEGEHLASMSKSIGLGCIEFSTLFANIHPDVVMLHGDRFDIFPAAIAAAMQNIHIAHIQGGEVSGTIDETIRHCITKLAHLHFVSNAHAAARVRGLGEHPETVFDVGCPSVDAILGNAYSARDAIIRQLNERHETTHDVRSPYLIVVVHPVTTEFDRCADLIEETLVAARAVGLPIILFYPNIDAGSKQMTSRLRRLEKQRADVPVTMLKDVPNRLFLNLLKEAACLVGNSSSGIREACYFGTPVVNVGTRQAGRDRGRNVYDAPADRAAIAAAIRSQLAHGRYPVEHVYGSGGSGARVAEILATVTLPPIQKRLAVPPPHVCEPYASSLASTSRVAIS